VSVIYVSVVFAGCLMLSLSPIGKSDGTDPLRSSLTLLPVDEFNVSFASETSEFSLAHTSGDGGGQGSFFGF